MTPLRTSTPESDVKQIADRINALDEQTLDHFGAWDSLRDLSSRTQFEAIDADPDSFVLDNNGCFEAQATIYVTLVYGSSRDEDSMSDEYPATIRGRLTNDGPEIADVVVDTSTFYE